MNPYQLDKLNEEDEAALGLNSILPQPSLEGNSPLNFDNFQNAQTDPTLFTNQLFDKTIADDNRLPDFMPMNEMVIEPEATTEVPQVEKLKAILKKKQELSNPNRAPASNVPPIQAAKPKEEESKPDDMYAQQGISKILQGLASMGGGKIDDNAAFYENYRKHQLDKPQRELEQKVKQRNFERMTKMDDPDSSESKNFRKALESLKYGQELKGAYGQDWEKLSANDKDTIFDIIRTKENLASKELQASLIASQRNDAREDRNYQREQAREDKLAQQQKLSEKQVRDLTAFDEGISLLSNIEVTKPQFDTGPVSSRQNAIAQFVGMDDSEKSGFKADVQSNVANYIKSISGAAVSDQERKFLIQNMPTMTDNDATFMSKLKIVKDRLERNRSGFLGNIKKSGKNTTEFDKKEMPKVDKEEKSDNKSKPKTVTQNGNTYTLNPETGEYE